MSETLQRDSGVIDPSADGDGPAAPLSTLSLGGASQQRMDALLGELAWAPRVSPGELTDAALLGSWSAGQRMRAAVDAPQIGAVIAQRYRIEARIGAGGMGVVFRATQLATGRSVALKWLNTSHARRSEEHDEAFRRFAREAQATARIRHANVVDVLDASRDPSEPFLVMEHLEGETLRALLDREGPLSWDRAIVLLLPVLDAVGEAHRLGVVHRDLKPDNVFLAGKGGVPPVPKVLDFGVSRLRDAEGAEHALTRTGTVLGTPAYMALEQLRALSDVDERADVYALGVMFYEMLSGRRPYEAKNAADYAAAIASGPSTPLSRHRPDLRGAREDAVMGALARAPGDRHRDISELTRALCAAPARRVRGRGTLALLALAACVLAVLALRGRAAQPAAVSERVPVTLPVHPAASEPAPRTDRTGAPLHGVQQAAPAEVVPVSPRRKARAAAAPAQAARPPVGDDAVPLAPKPTVRSIDELEAELSAGPRSRARGAPSLDMSSGEF